MYIAFGNRIEDSNDFAKLIEEETEFKIVKDMSKGSKREDIVAYNMSVSVEDLNEEIKEAYDITQLSEDELFEEYMTLAEELAVEAEEILPEDALVQFAAYKWDKSDNDIKVVLAIAHESLGEPKLRDVMKRLLKQVE